VNSNIAANLGLALQPQKIKARGVTNNSLDILGKSDVVITIGKDTRVEHSLFVANAITHVILGTDFLAKPGEVSYDFQRCTLGFNQRKLPMGPEAINNVARTAYSVDIPPLSEMAVVATFISPSLDGAICYFEGDKLPQKVMVGKSIDRVVKRCIWVPVNTVVGNVKQVEENLELFKVNSPKVKPKTSSKPSSSLKLEDTTLDLLQFQKLRGLVNEFQDIIGESPTLDVLM